jgi:hypothetical protein
MAMQNVDASQSWFTGADRVFLYIVRHRSTGALRDLTDFTAFDWYMTRKGGGHGAEKLIPKSLGDGIEVTVPLEGEVEVTIDGADTLEKTAEDYDLWLWGHRRRRAPGLAGARPRHVATVAGVATRVCY